MTSTKASLRLLGYLVGPFLSMVDSSIVNVALVDISRSLSGSLAHTQWVVSAYLLAMSAALPLTGWLARKFGLVRVFAASIVGFTLASAACGLSPSLAALIAARTVQGLFGAFLIPLAMTKLLGEEASRAAERTAMPALFGLILFMAPAIAPSLGGILLQVASWPLIFFINVPFGIFGVVLVLRREDQSDTATARAESPRFDFAGLVMLSAGLAGVTYGSSSATAHGWFSMAALPFWGGGFLAVALYALLAARTAEPAVDLRTLRIPEVAAADVVSMLTSVAAFGMIILSLVFLQEVRGVSALVAGLAMFPQAILTGIGTGVGPAIVKRIGLRATASLGLVLLVGGTLLLLFVGSATSVLAISLMLTGRAFAIGLVIQPLTMMLNTRVRGEKRTDVNTLFMICQRLGGAFGVSIVVTYFEERARHLGPTLGSQATYAAFHQSVVLLALVGMGSLAVAALLLRGTRNPDAV